MAHSPAGSIKVDRLFSRAGGGGGTSTNLDRLEAQNSFIDGTLTAVERRQAAGRIWTHSCRGFQSTPCCSSSPTRRSLMQPCVVLRSSRGVKRHDIPQNARLAGALPAIQRRAALSGSNEPIHIKRHNESPVSPNWLKTTGCR